MTTWAGRTGETSFAAEITVDPAHPPPEPQVKVELADTELPYDEWTIVRGRVTNTGAVGVSDLTVTLSGQVSTDDRSAAGHARAVAPGTLGGRPVPRSGRASGRERSRFTWISRMNIDPAVTWSPRLRASGWSVIT